MSKNLESFNDKTIKNFLPKTHVCTNIQSLAMTLVVQLKLPNYTKRDYRHKRQWIPIVKTDHAISKSSSRVFLRETSENTAKGKRTRNELKQHSQIAFFELD